MEANGQALHWEEIINSISAGISDQYSNRELENKVK